MTKPIQETKVIENPLQHPLGSLNTNLLEAETSSSTDENEQALLSFNEAFQEAMYRSLAFVLPRLFVAGKNFTNAIITAGLPNPDAIEGMALASLFQQLMLGIIKGGTITIDSLIAELNSQNKKENIGPLINQGLLLSSAIGIPATILFFTSNTWLQQLGISPSVAQQAGNYLRALSYSVLPTCWTMIDQGALLSIDRKWSPTAFNALFVCGSMAIGYPMTLYTQDVTWLAYGISIAGIAVFILDRTYLYFNKTNGKLDRETYKLFSLSLESGYTFSDVLKLYSPAVLQGLSEWLPSLLTTFIIASNDSEAADEAQVPSVHLVVAFTQILLALSAASTILVSEKLGPAKLTNENSMEYQKAIKNARKIGYAMTAVAASFTSIVAAFCLAYPDSLVKLFCHNEESFELSKSMLRITGITLLLDGIRNALTGALLGRNQLSDNFFTSLSNLIITAGTATILGVFTQKEIGNLSLFLWKMMGIMATTTILGFYWEKQSKSLTSPPLAKTLWCMWSSPDEQGSEMVRFARNNENYVGKIPEQPVEVSNPLAVV